MTRKAIVIAMLLVAATVFAGCQVTMLSPDDPQAVKRAEAKQAEADTVERIRTMKIVQAETLLIRDIMLLKAEIAKIQAAGAPLPRTKPAPLPELPADMR